MAINVSNLSVKIAKNATIKKDKIAKSFFNEYGQSLVKKQSKNHLTLL